MNFFSSDDDHEGAANLVIQNILRKRRKPRRFKIRRFKEDIPEREFREKYRVPKAVVDHLEEKFQAQLTPKTRRNNSLSARQQILTFLRFLGSNSFYHIVKDCHGLSSHTVYRIVHKVGSLVYGLRNEVIKWPENKLAIASQFYDIGGMPSVCGCLDGTHVLISPPKQIEEGYVNRHHSHSINSAVVCGPDLRVYFCSSKSPGRWHDSKVSYSRF